jgi:polysaccharide biosynthesis protein PslG
MKIRPGSARTAVTPLTRTVFAVLLTGLILTATAFATTTGHRAPNASAHRCRHNHRSGRCNAKAHLTRLDQLTAAPNLELSGLTLSWKRIPGARGYVLARTASGQSYQYSAVKGTSITPQNLPGKTVYYWVRTQASHSAWSATVTISYPAQTVSNSAPSSVSSNQTASNSPAPSGATEELTTGSAGTGTPSTPEPNSSLSGSTEFGPFIKGIDTNMQGWGAQAVPQIAAEMHTLGVTWEREDLAWSSVEPQRGVFDWSSFDHIVAAAETSGVTILPVVGYAPSWTSPADATDYAQFVRAAVERYGPGTSANLQWWELWNEPYASYAWSGQTPDAEQYARDALAAAEAAKSVSPSAKLLIAAEYNDSPQTGGTSPWETTWVKDMFTAAPTLGQWIAGVAVHPYGGDPALPLEKAGSWKNIDGEWAFQRIDTIREQFLEHGMNVPFWITEDGWSTDSVSEAAQAQDYLALIEQIAARPWIRAFFPYCLREFSPEATNGESAFGLLKFGTWQPKAAFSVLQAGFKTLS